MIWHLFLRFEPKGKTYWDKATFTYCVWNIHCQGKSKVLWAWHNTFFWVVFSTLCGSFRSMLQIFITCQKFPEWNFQCSLCKPFILYESFHQSNMLVQSNLAIRKGLIRNKLVLRNHFLWPICHLHHKDKELLALRNNSRATKKFLIAKFDCSILQ